MRDLICLSHLRWGFVFQRPQHLMSRFARERRVFYFEEPVSENALPDGRAHLQFETCLKTGVVVCTPMLPNGLAPKEVIRAQRDLLNQLLDTRQLAEYVAWYYTPMAREFSRHLSPAVTVYDCMDELSAFAGAPPAMKPNERELFEHADFVFTGGARLYEAKRRLHPAVYLFPSSVDTAHFRGAREQHHEPADQAGIAQPRLGYAGVIDERMDPGLLRDIAALAPEWHFVMLGPIVKIDPAILPRAPNLHYLGIKAYSDLPAYLSGWRIGMLPFALNDSTLFISPTKTPEYLAAGLRVISTPIRDVVSPYGDLGLAEIVSDARDFISVAKRLLASPQDSGFEEQADLFLAGSSWDRTWAEMDALIEGAYQRSRKPDAEPEAVAAQSIA